MTKVVRVSVAILGDISFQKRAPIHVFDYIDGGM